jgi:hypothetical protein
MCPKCFGSLKTFAICAGYSMVDDAMSVTVREEFAVVLSDRAFASLTISALLAVGFAATPALSAMDASGRAEALSALVGRFTPATGDPVLLERYANLPSEARQNFRFTPAMTRSENRAVTLVVRARPLVAPSATPVIEAERPSAPPTITITPVAYRLGSAVGYTAFAGSAQREPVDLASLPTARRPAEQTASGRPSRFGAQMRLESRSLPDANAQALDPDRVYSVDVTGSYRLSRNLDLTAGVRVQRENDRLQPLTDERRDSQAVYVGTQFRF